MIILGIETSCDETAVSIVNFEGHPSGNKPHGDFGMEVLGNALNSQINMHKEFGGVVPMMAKREHAKNLIPLFRKALEDAKMYKIADRTLDSHPHADDIVISEKDFVRLIEIFGREEDFRNNFIDFITTIKRPIIDAVAVTEGPGLEPALWMGIIFAQALSYVLKIPIIPVNHMEGHILSVLPQKIEFPALALLISGGHTELVLVKDWHSYEMIGQTRDDAVGEAFDKVARMLDLPYPGGPEISRLALEERTRMKNNATHNVTHKTSTVPYILPRPMIHSNDFDFSFSGLKTAVLYSLKDQNIPKETVAKEFEDAVTEVLVAKTMRAVEDFNIKTLILGGGVVSNDFIRGKFEETIEKYSDIKLLLPLPNLRTDNALMIAIAGYSRWLQTEPESGVRLTAKGTLRLA